MANKIVRTAIQHCGDSPYGFNSSLNEKEVDKSKSISQLDSKELYRMLSRLRDERDLQRVIRELKVSAGERDTYDKPLVIDASTPIKDLYHSDDEFAHFGIKGQKWGLRRFQNEDGTRTAAGKKRYPDPPNSEKSTENRPKKAKKLSDLSNEDLKKMNERLQLEETFKKLTSAQMDKSKSWVKESISKAAEQAVTDFTKGVFLGSAKLMVQKMSPEFAEAAFKMKQKKSGGDD